MFSRAPKEITSVVLRRQVPIRFDEHARSWIGGLPKMPVAMEWPHSKQDKPLHFIAQINCADLPLELWGGLGPRAGWLLLFVDIEAIVEQDEHSSVRVHHVTELGPEAAPPSNLYFARRDITDVSTLPIVLDGAQRRHFRKWPLDLVPTGAHVSDLTGAQLYGAPEDDVSLHAPSNFSVDRPLTWRGAYTILAGLVLRHSTNGYESNWLGNSGGLLDYPEPDAKSVNKEWQARREELRESSEPWGISWTTDARLRAEIYDERRNGWTERALIVLDEEMLQSVKHLDDYRAQVTAALNAGDSEKVFVLQQSVDYFEKQVTDRQRHRIYLIDLFAQYPSEQALVEEIRTAGRAHLEWAQHTQDRLMELLEQTGKMDLDAPIAPGDWDEIVSQIESMKSIYWQSTYDTQLLRKVERGVQLHSLLRDVVREEILDYYASPSLSVHAINPEIVAILEPQLRHLETGRPHMLGRVIDSVYDDQLEKNHILLFQIASDNAAGWIFGDLRCLCISIHWSELASGSFDSVRAWLEA